MINISSEMHSYKTGNNNKDYQQNNVHTVTSTLSHKSGPSAAKKSHYHFGGPFGATLICFSIPLFILTLNILCSKDRCTLFQIPSFPKELSAYFDYEAACIYLGWIAFQAVLFALPIGQVVEGEPIANNKRLKYRLNGFQAFLISLGTLALVIYLDYPLEIIHEKFFALHVTAITFSYLLSFILYLKSFTVPESYLNPIGCSGNLIYDFYMGREHNPRIAHFDIKVFLELRPGLIGWVAINLAFLTKDYKDHGFVNPTLLLLCLGQFIYVWDAVFFEEAVLTTLDITTEGLGFMLVYGDLVFVPFVFTLTPRFVLEQHYQLPYVVLIPLFLLTVSAYVIFRLANDQKHYFTRSPNTDTNKLKVISGKGGKLLLADGWWGWVRHPNYFADIILGLSWCMYSGFNNILPYTYFIYHITVLTHRSSRDDEFCRQTFGKGWDIYCQQVKYRIFKYIF